MSINRHSWYTYSMVRVNRNLLSGEDSRQLLRRFDDALAMLTLAQTTMVLNELLGKEERLTIAKRLIAIVLIYEGYSEYKTAQLLKLSHSTTKIIAKKVKNNHYKGIIRLLTKRKLDYEELVNSIMSILHLGGILPRRVGLDRYRSLKERRESYHLPKTKKTNPKI